MVDTVNSDVNDTLQTEESPWDNVENVPFEFIQTRRSQGDGILSTHDNNFKVWLWSVEWNESLRVYILVSEKYVFQEGRCHVLRLQQSQEWLQGQGYCQDRQCHK